MLFADLSGFTRLGRELDPEDLKSLLDECLSELLEEVTAREGWLDKQIGDAILAVFGAPIAHEDDPVRALRAAIAMQARMEAVNVRLKARLTRPLALHIGVNTGLVVTGPGLDTGIGEFTVIGDTVNSAARLNQAARSGQVVVGEATYAATREKFHYRRTSIASTKEGEGDLVAYECLGEHASADGQRYGARTGSELVGREGELGELVDAVEALEPGGRGGVVAIVGEAGVGKSRLIVEARGRTEMKDCRWLEGHPLSRGQTVGHWQFREILRRDAGIGDNDGSDESIRKLERRVRMFLPEAVEDVLPYLATLLAVDVRGDLAQRVRYLDAEALKHQVFRATRRWFERLAREQPLVLVFEDWHWADESSEELLEHLLDLVASVPLLLVCVCRPGADTPAARLRNLSARELDDKYVEIGLLPLSARESGELMRNLLHSRDLPARLQTFVLRKADGNPFFLEEILHALIEGGGIIHDDARIGLKLASEAEQVALPSTIEGVIAARIDRLPEDLKEVVRIAAVIGRSFLFRVLRELTPAGIDLERRLVELRSLDLIHEQEGSLEREFVFKHAMTQEAIYGSILLRRRRKLHLGVAEALVALFADRVDEFLGVLAFHYAHAEDWERAQEYLLRAGDQAGSVAADAEALAYYRQAISAYARAFGDRWEPLQRATLERKIGEALLRRGAHDESAECLQRALCFLDSPLPTTRLGMRLAILRQVLRQVGHRALPAALARRTSADIDPVIRERCQIYEVLRWIDYFIDQERLVLADLHELNVAETAGYAPGVSRASFALGVVCDMAGAPRLAARYHRRAVEVAEELRHPILIGEAYLGLTLHDHYARGDWAATVEHGDRSKSAFQDAGDLRGWGALSAGLAWGKALRGDIAPALELGVEIARVGRESADTQVWAWGVGTCAIAFSVCGASEEAVPQVIGVIGLLEAIPDYLSLANGFGTLATCYLRLGKLDEARDAISQGEALIASRRLRGYLATPVVHARAEASLLAIVRSDDADAAQLLGAAGHATAALLRQLKVNRELEPAAYRLRGTYELLRSRPKRAEWWWSRSIVAAKQQGLPFERAESLVALGRHVGNAVLVAEGRTIHTDLADSLARWRSEAEGTLVPVPSERGVVG